ncbi:hypothetical protein D3C76_1610910 [compost metagenome]
MGEIHRLLALVGNGHRRQGRIDFLHFQRRNQAIELALDPLAFDLHLRAQGIADVVVEADDLALVILRGEGWIGGFNANT